MIALAGDEIIADPTSIVGSIGVVSGGFGFPRAAEEDRRRAAGLHGGRPTRRCSIRSSRRRSSDIEFLKGLQLEIHDVFIRHGQGADAVRLPGRHARISSRGLFWTGQAWVRNSALVDSSRRHAGAKLKKRYRQRKARLRARLRPARSLFGRRAARSSRGRRQCTGPLRRHRRLPVSSEAAEERALWGALRPLIIRGPGVAIAAACSAAAVCSHGLDRLPQVRGRVPQERARRQQEVRRRQETGTRGTLVHGPGDGGVPVEEAGVILAAHPALCQSAGASVRAFRPECSGTQPVRQVSPARTPYELGRGPKCHW